MGGRKPVFGIRGESVALLRWSEWVRFQGAFQIFGNVAGYINVHFSEVVSEIGNGPTKKKKTVKKCLDLGNFDQKKTEGNLLWK